ncbi:MAG: helix-hairpin-helix domain-containing protein [Ferruginibacter sp.]
MKILLLSFLLLSFLNSAAQVTDSLASTTEQQLENITENNEDQETEDDSYLQEIVQLQRNPINLNTANESDLKNIKLLSPIHIANFLAYRQLLGKLINLYELQAVPGWDVQTILKIRPYVTVSNEISLYKSIGERLQGGDATLLVRTSQVIEQSKGFLIDSAVAKNYYLGSPQRLMVRYKYNYKNILQYGIVAEKDPGEQFFKGRQNRGFDFYSAHFFVKDAGKIKALALGDFTVNLGQGLVQWQSLAFKKGPDVLATKRQAPVLKPYNSSGEINFHRGAGVTVVKNHLQATLFGSFKKIDANFVTDTIETTDDFVSSLQISGYHRTRSEGEDKNVQRQLAYGGNISYRRPAVQIGLNAIRYNFKYPIKKVDVAYNRLALSGKNFGNYSVDYGYTLKNMHFFGELASTDQHYLALINGLLISVANNIDLSFLYRNISPGYQSLYSNAFTESTFPTNEKGLFSGISIKPAPQWQISAYVDLYQFPGVKFRVNAPTAGADYLVQLNYKPNKEFEAYTRFKEEAKGINVNPFDFAISPVLLQPRKNWRTQVSYKINTPLTLRNRVEVVWFNDGAGNKEQGFMLYQDILYKPQLSRIAGNIRLMYFETDSYNTRIYAFENDVLYSYSIPVFYDKGYRYYLNLNYDITSKLTAWVKFSQSFYPEKGTIGSGLDEIKNNRRSEVKIQALYRF